MESKATLRKRILEQRNAISAEERIRRSSTLRDHLQMFIDDNNFDLILSFLPVKGEPNLEPSIDNWVQSAMTLGLPRVMGSKRIEFFPWKPGDSLELSAWGIREPLVQAPLVCTPSTLVCVPALAVDPAGNRLGYGGGFYDRFLQHNPQTTAVAIVFQEFFVPQVPNDPWDRRVSHVCTEHACVSI